MTPESTDGKQVLITGATGFIGSSLAQELHERGYRLRALIRQTSNVEHLEHLPIEFVTADLSDVSSLQAAVSDVDQVFHVAGVVAARDAEGFRRGNQQATENMLEAVGRFNPNLDRFIHVSSLAAIGPASQPDSPVDETTSPHPITTYGVSKQETERIVMRWYGELPITIVRPPAVYGPRDVGVYTFFQLVAKAGIAPLIGFDRKLVSLVHVEDLVRGFVLAAESPMAVSQEYFISSERFHTWEEVGKIAAEAVDRQRVRHLRIPHSVVYAAAGVSGFLGRFQKKPPILDFEKGRDITQQYWICSVEKAKQDFGYAEQMPVEIGVPQTVSWYRKHNWL